jgi:two-component system sensor histidine kinase KdpD
MKPTTRPGRLPQPARTWVAVIALLCGATAGGFLLDHHVSLTSQAMVYVLVVVIASYKLGLIESVVCALGAVTAFNFFFVPPRWTFEVDSREHLIALVTMLAVALVVNHLAAALRRETDLARLNEKRARQLQELAGKLADAISPDGVAVLGEAALNEVFDGPSFVSLLQPDGALDTGQGLEAMAMDGLRSCMREAAVLGPGTGRWPGLNAWYLPLGTREHMSGAACVQNVLASDTTGLEHAQALCTMLGQALWRLKLTSSMLAAQSETQRQQVQSTFLAAVSHDLRTPLATIVGAASALQTQGDKLGACEQARLLGSIASEAAYLSTLTENTLQLVQLGNSARPPVWDWESMEEIVGAALARSRLQDPDRRIKSRVPVGLPLIQADPVLLAQLLGNLLENALKYSQDAIELNVQLAEGNMQLSVKDRGEMIPAAMHQTIFEPYSRNDHSGQRGAGLGLALCRAIAARHGGSLNLRRRPGGGNCFTFSMPINPQQPGSDQP